MNAKISRTLTVLLTTGAFPIAAFAQTGASSTVTPSPSPIATPSAGVFVPQIGVNPGPGDVRMATPAASITAGETTNAGQTTATGTTTGTTTSGTTTTNGVTTGHPNTISPSMNGTPTGGTFTAPSENGNPSGTTTGTSTSGTTGGATSSGGTSSGTSGASGGR